MPESHDTVVIGGGQAGLAMSAVLQQHGREHVVLERRRVGERWRTARWDSLRFQFPNWSVQLPGYRYTGDNPEGFAHHREILGIIENYAASTRAPVCEHTEVVRVAEADHGNGFHVALADRSVHTRHLVIATGPFHRPRIPAMADSVAPSVWQTDPTRYRNPEELPPGAVLVVGSGGSGCQIADELLQAGRRVFLSVSRHRRTPRRYRGKDLYWWLEAMGRFTQTIDSFPGRRWPPSLVVTGVNGGYDVNVREMAANGARVVGRVRGTAGDTVSIQPNANQILDQADQAYADFLSVARGLAAEAHRDDLPEEQPSASEGLPATVPEVDRLDLAAENITTIIWATGYSYDFGWMTVPVFDEYGRPIQDRGVTPRPGLYFLGLHWMHTFKSGLLAGVGSDAEYLAHHIDGITHRR